MENVKYKIFGLPIFEKRSEAVLSNLSEPSKWLTELVGGQDTFSGVKVNADTALRFSAVWACVRIISNTVAMPPFGVYRKDANGDRFPFPDHPTHFLIHNEPNENMGSFTWRQTMQSHATLKGNGYSIIHRDGSYRPVSLELISNPDTVEPFKYEGRIYYKVEGIDRPYTSDEIFHIKGLGFDGLKGKSVISIARQSIGAALAAQEYGGRVFQSGAGKRLALMHEKTLNDTTKKNLRESWKSTYGGINNSQEVAILEAGVKAVEIGMNPEDAQFIATKEFSVNDVARWFGLVMDLLATDKNPTYGSAEQRAIDFIKYTMNPWYITWEEESNRKLFRTSEKKDTYTKFNVNGLLRGDAAARANYYKDLFYIGALSRDEIRALEERNKVADGDKYYLQTNMAPAEQVGLNTIKDMK